MAIPPPPSGWTRFLVKSKFGPDVTSPFSIRRRRSGGTSWGTLLGVPKHMTISDAGGAEVASLEARMFSPIKSRMSLQVASGDPWQLEGSFIEKDYSITAAGGSIARSPRSG